MTMGEDDIDVDSGNELDNDELAGEGQEPSSGKATLKRGDACLACRRRRIRCNAAKPSCATCTRLKKQCVYETGKSTSRIAVLKQRIAELENQLKTGQTPESSGPSPPVPSSSTAEATPAGINIAQTINPASLGFTAQGFGIEATFNNATQQVHATHTHVHGHVGGDQRQQTYTPSLNSAPTTTSSGTNHTTPEQQHDARYNANGTSTAGSRQLPYAQSSNPRPFGPPDPNFDFDLSFLDYNVTDISQSMFNMGTGPPVPPHPNMNSSMMPPPPGQGPPQPMPQPRVVPKDNHCINKKREAVNQMSAQRGDATKAALAMGDLVGVNGGSAPYNNGNTPATPFKHSSKTPDDDVEDFHYQVPTEEMSILPNIPQGRELVGGWFDPNDVPPPVRDHLLDLFFSRNAANLVVDLTLHLPRFYMRLTLPPSKRPHPGLLYSIYATAARMSTQPGIKQLESQFFEIADKQLRISVANHDRLLDTVRGMTLLTSYLFAKEKYSLGYHMCGAAVRLAIACGLDRIPSSVWTAPPPFNAAIHCTLRTGGYSIPPPDDPVELAERIYAFWSVYEVDLCTAIAYLWHTGLPIEDVRTPFPRPLFEYELGLVSIQDDISLQSLLDPPPTGHSRSADSSFIVLRMKALTLLARVLKLRQERPEVDSPPSPSAGPPTCSYPGSPAPAFATHPAGFVRIKRALDNYAAQLPQEHKAPWQWDEGDNMMMPRVAISRESSVLHFLLGNAYMQLWNVRSLDADNAVALLVARRLVNVMYLFQTEPMSTGYDIFMITIWNEVAMVLVREVKRLSHIGERARAAEVDSDLGVAIAAMKKWGDVDISNQHDGSDIAAINGKMLEQLRLMSEEDWAEAMVESSRRFGGTGGDSAGCEIPPVAIDRARGGVV